MKTLSLEKMEEIEGGDQCDLDYAFLAMDIANNNQLGIGFDMYMIHQDHCT
jgi:hypothetical protein